MVRAGLCLELTARTCPLEGGNSRWRQMITDEETGEQWKVDFRAIKCEYKRTQEGKESTE